MSYIFLVIILVLIHFGLWKMFEKAGRSGWEALIPFYREYVITKLIGRPAWWLFLLIIPIFNIFIAISLYLDFVKSFMKRRFWEHAAAVLVPFVVFPLWGTDAVTRYAGKSVTAEFKEKYPYKKTAVREWADAIIFATVAATLIRTFLIEAYMIPSGSMEKSLLVGDHIFVSKLNYGVRIPMTPVAFPFSHHTLPIGGKAYWEGIKLGYKRLPSFEKIERNDVVVFNQPMEADPPLRRPVDKRENIIKRCIAISGDTLTIVNAQVYVNGKAVENAPESETNYYVKTNGTDINPQTLLDMRIEAFRQSENLYRFTMTKAESEMIASWANVESLTPEIAPEDTADQEIFPHSPCIPGMLIITDPFLFQRKDGPSHWTA